MAKKITNTELVTRVKELLKRIRKLTYELEKRQKMLQSIEKIVGKENFDQMLLISGYRLKKGN